MTAVHKRRMGSADVAAVLRRAISKGNLQLHDRLPAERHLADTYNVSRGTIREALNRLQREKLVEIRRGSGTYVAHKKKDISDDLFENARPLELIDARFALEPHICRLAVLHGRRSDFEELEELLKKMERGVEDPTAFSEADTAFHAKLAEATGNSLLVWIISQVNSVRTLDEWMRVRHLTLEKNIIVQYNAQHRQIVNAIRSREPERAATLMKEHLETARLSLTRAAAT